MTLSFTFFSFGLVSPVAALSSTDPLPLVTTPSMDTTSPVQMMITLPTLTSSSGMMRPSFNLVMRGSFDIPLVKRECATDMKNDLSESDTIYTVITVAASNHSFISTEPITANNISMLMSNFNCKMLNTELYTILKPPKNMSVMKNICTINPV